MQRFRLELDLFHGPVELLLYLVRKEELDPTDVSVAKLTAQFLEYVGTLQQIDVDSVGEFLDMASWLLEIKSRMVLPGEEQEIQQELADPREELVRRLLEYKQYRDAASMLEERSRQWTDCFPRLACDMPARPRSLEEQPIHEVELWDLVSAFGRVLKAKQTTAGPENIR